MLLVSGRSELGIKVSPVQARVAVLLKGQVGTLETVLDPSPMLNKQEAAVAMSAFCHF